MKKAFLIAIDSILAMYKPEVTQVQFNLLDSHDTPRFLTCAGNDINSLKLALIFMFTYPGAPCIFYGDEIGLSGHHDPECRQPFPWDENKWNHDLRDFVKQLIDLRKSNKAFRLGTYIHLPAADGVYAFKRSTDNDTYLIALNTAEEIRNLDFHGLVNPSNQGKLLFGTAEININGEDIHLTIPSRVGVVIKL